MGVIRPRLLFLVTEDWYFWSHRLNLARAARDNGFEVIIVTRVHKHGKVIRDEGFRLLPITLRRRSRNPFREVATIIKLVHLYRHEGPHIVHHVAMKPILYGSLAARIAQVPAVVNAFAGLGYTFISSNRRAKFLRLFLGIALRWILAIPNSRVVFQNNDDCEQLVRVGIVDRTHCVIIRGAGIDITRFTNHPEKKGIPIIVLVSRMLWDKGVGEFAEAARILFKQGVHGKFVLVGMLDKENPAHITKTQLLAWQKEGIIEWWGYNEDMPNLLASIHVVVLPSYREGLPKALLEAAACARPIVGTDVPGCREIVRDGENGLLVPPRDPKALARAIDTLIHNSELRARMGTRGREIVEKEFSADQVAHETLVVYRDLLKDLLPVKGELC